MSCSLYQSFGYNNKFLSTTECKEEGDLRLERVISGILNICHNSTWRLVCDDEWDLADAMVVCKQLGLELIIGNNVRLFALPVSC